MYAACKLGYLNCVKRRIESSIDPNATLQDDEYRGTALHVAARFGHLNIVKYLANLDNCNMNATNSEGYTALHVASSWGRLTIVKFFVEEKNLNPMHRCVGRGLTPLHIVCAVGHVNIAKYLVNERGVNPSCTDDNGSTPLHLVKSVEVAKFLVEDKHCDVNKMNNSNKTPLLNAAWNRQVSMFRYLIFCGHCDASLRGNNGWTTLHAACQLGLLDVVKYLVNEQGLDPSCTDDNGSTPLHLVKSVEVAKFLVEDKHCDVNKMNNSNKTPLLNAAWNRQVSMFRYLVFCGHCDITLRSNSGRTALHAACQLGLLDVVKYLVNEQGLDPSCIDIDRATPLYFTKTVEVAKFLVEEKRCDANWRDKFGRTPLHKACNYGYLGVVKYLVNELRVDPLCTSNEGYTPLHLAKTVEVAKFLVKEKGCGANRKAKNGWTPLHSACNLGYLYVAQYLVNELGVDPSCTDNDGATPLHLAKTVEVAKFLVEEKRCDAYWRAKNGGTPLHSACNLGHLDMAKYLVNELGVDPSLIANNQATPLHFAKTVEVAKFLVEEKGCDANWRDNIGQTALHKACNYGYLGVVKYLVNELRVDPLCTSNEGYIPLHLAKTVEVAIFLVKEKRFGAIWKAKNGWTPLHSACNSGHLSVVLYLVNGLGVDPSCTDNDGATPLHLAKTVEVAKFLVKEKGCGANRRNSFGRTPLHSACNLGHLDVVKYLVNELGVNLSCIDNDGATPLHLAKTIEVGKFLVEEKFCDANWRDNNGLTPLHTACKHDFLDISEFLLNWTNVNPRSCRDNTGSTPLHYVKSVQMAKILVEEAVCNINARDNSGNTPLLKAALHGELLVFRYLVFCENCNVLVTAENGWSPLHTACKYGFLDVVKRVIKRMGDSSNAENNSLLQAERDKGQTPLHIACQNGHPTFILIVEYLINKTVINPCCEDYMGKIPLNYITNAKKAITFINASYKSSGIATSSKNELFIFAKEISERFPNQLNVCLNIACESGHLEAVKSLVLVGANPSSKDFNGNTPLHLVARSGQMNIVQFIVKNDRQGTLKFKNHMNRTPMEEARNNSHFHIALYLILRAEPDLYPIHAVSKPSHVEVLKEYLLNSDPSEGNTLLHFAVQSDNTEIVLSVIHAKGDYSHCYALNKSGYTPLQTAIKYGCLKVVRYMLRMFEESTKNTSPSSLIHTACYAGHLNVLKCLVQEFNFSLDCVDDKGRSPLYSAVAAGKFEVIKYLVEQNQCDLNKVSVYTSDTLLHVASSNGHMNIVLYLLSMHCKLSGDEFTWHALHAACQGGHLDIARHLIIYADVDPLCSDSRGNIPLHYAANSGNIQLVEYLINCRECPKNPKNQQNNTPLHNAAVSGHYSIVKHLIETGICSPEDKGCFEQTALHYACQGGHFEIVKYLMEEQNQDAAELDERGCSALDLAAGHDSIVTYLSDNVKSSEEPPAKRPRLDTHSELASGEDGSANSEEDSASSKEDSDDIRPGPPAKRLKLTAAKRRGRLQKNVSGMPKRDLEAVRKQLLPNIKKRAQCGKELGFGSYGRVVEIRIAGNPKVYAGKIFKPSDCIEFHKVLYSEFSILSQLKHPNIVSYYGICELPKEDIPVLLMERLDTNLHDYLCENQNTELSVKLSILLDVANGLIYLHCQIPVIIHRDLTARNVLLDKYLNGKISDFGNSRMMTYGCDMTPESMTSVPGTRDYMPPEAMDDIEEETCYDMKLDVFSFGHLALFCGLQRPIIPLYQTYYNASNEFCCRSELERRHRYMTELKSKLGDSHPLIGLIIQCLDDEPEERPSTETLRAQMQCLAPVKELDERHMNDIYGYLHVLQKPQMVRLGQVLGLKYTRLTGMMDTHLFHEEVIAAWLRKDDYVTDDEERTPTWVNLVAALRHDTVRQNGIATQIYQHQGLKFFLNK